MRIQMLNIQMRIQMLLHLLTSLLYRHRECGDYIQRESGDYSHYINTVNVVTIYNMIVVTIVTT